MHYRQRDHKTQQLKCLKKSQHNISNKSNNSNSIVILQGDFNAVHIEWEYYIIKSNADNRAVHQKPLEIIADKE